MALLSWRGFSPRLAAGHKVAPFTTAPPAQPSAVSSRYETALYTWPADFPSHDLGEERLPGVSSGLAFALNFASTRISAAVLFRGSGL